MFKGYLYPFIFILLSSFLFFSSLKELHHDMLCHFFNGLSCGSDVGKPKNNGFLRIKNTKGLIPKQKGTRRRLKRIGNDDFEKFSLFFSKDTDDDVTPLIQTNGSFYAIFKNKLIVNFDIFTVRFTTGNVR